MKDGALCQITTKDYMILEAIADRAAGSSAYRELLRAKLRGAQVIFGDDVPPSVATINSRLRFAADGREEERVLVHAPPGDSFPAPVLAITTLRGLAMLGMTEGQTITFPDDEWRFDTIVLQEIAYQPEHAQRIKSARPMR